MSDQEEPRLSNAPHTTAEQDALLDVIDHEQPPASTGHGDTDMARASARRARAVRLRIAGATYEQIARECGYNDKSTARKAVVRALERLEVESVTELRTLENARLDSDEVVLRRLIADANQPATTRIRAIDSRLRLSAARRRLNGLDAPLQVQISAGVAADLQDALEEAASVIGEVVGITEEPLPPELLEG